MKRAKSKTKRKPNRRASKADSPASLPVVPETNENVVHCRAPPPDELDTSTPDLKHLGGGKSDKWNNFLVNQAMNASWFFKDLPPNVREEHCAAVLGFLAGINPKDTTEGMMAAQLYASHAGAMECYRRAMAPDNSMEASETYFSLAAKLTKANAAQVEALKKYRSNGQQKVVVEHVHVYQGGQAIVGNVTPGGSGKNKEVQPYAIGYAESPEMRCKDAEREAVPVSRNA